MATNQDIKLTLGDEWIIVCTCRHANNDLFIIEEAEWRMATSNSEVLVAQVGDGITVTANGKCEIRITPDEQETANVQPGSYFHELFVSGDNVASIQVVGKARVMNSLRSQFS
jgi:hypothetical protein